MSKIPELTASTIVTKISNGKLSSLEVAQSFVKQSKIWNNINSLINFDEEKFLAAAHNADKLHQSGGKIGPLHGLPIVIKDNIDVKGFVTSAATRGLEDFIPDKQGLVANALINAGAIIMAKTNMHELAFTPGITQTDETKELSWGAFGSAKNPYNPELSPSGSSSGTAAAISARIAPAGLGTDTGGSVRNPSAWCGVSGLRPTTKRYSQGGVVPLSWTRDTIGPMAKTVADLSLMDSVITEQNKLPPVEFSNLRIGIDRNFFCADCAPDINILFENELDRLAKERVEIIEIDLRGLDELINQIGHSIVRHEVIRALPDYLKSSGLEIGFDQVAEKVTASGLGQLLKSISSTEAVSDAEYYHAKNNLRPKLQKIYTNVFFEHKLDAVAFPSTLVPPNQLDSHELYNLGDRKVSYLMASSHNVQPASIGGYPGLTLPIGLTSQGLPAAMGLDGLPNSDRKLLAIGMAYEKIKPALPAPEPRTKSDQFC